MLRIKYFLITFIASLMALSAMGQGKKPTIMVVPSETWCVQNGYKKTLDNQGVVEIIPDYRAAFNSDKDLNAVITKINLLMADNGFPFKDMERTMKSISTLSTEDRLIKSKTSGAEVVESELDLIRRQAKADIIVELDWTVVKESEVKNSINFNLAAFDAYTDKQVAGVQGTGGSSISAPIPVLLQEAVQDYMDAFAMRIEDHFEDLQVNGREVTLDMSVFESADIDFESEFDGYELNEIIDNWLHEKCVNHRFSKSDATNTMLLYEQVRIPFYKENGMAMDTYGFARELARYIKKTYNIEVKTVNRGLGRCKLVFGEK